jgi:hypothetical protein
MKKIESRSNTYDVNNPDVSFKEALNKSKEYVSQTANWLLEKGYPVTINPTFFRPHISERNEYSDHGDLTVQFNVEVKHRPDMFFTKKEDFPYNSIIVDDAVCYDKMRTKPYAYFIWNAEGTVSILVDVRKTERHWIKLVKFDRFKKIDRTFYECPIKYCSFINCNGL